METSLEPGRAELSAIPATENVAAELETQYETVLSGLRLLASAFPEHLKCN